MQHWYEVGKLEANPWKKFQSVAEALLRNEGLQGHLARLVVTEPSRAAWGMTGREVSQRVLEFISDIAEPQSGFMLTDKGLTPETLGGHPDVASALESGAIKFLVGFRPDGLRQVAILLLN